MDNSSWSMWIKITQQIRTIKKMEAQNWSEMEEVTAFKGTAAPKNSYIKLSCSAYLENCPIRFLVTNPQFSLELPRQNKQTNKKPLHSGWNHWKTGSKVFRDYDGFTGGFYTEGASILQKGSCSHSSVSSPILPWDYGPRRICISWSNLYLSKVISGRYTYLISHHMCLLTYVMLTWSITMK